MSQIFKPVMPNEQGLKILPQYDVIGCRPGCCGVGRQARRHDLREEGLTSHIQPARECASLKAGARSKACHVEYSYMNYLLDVVCG